MDCRDVQHLLHPYSDGELDLVRHLQIEHHLAECATCAERDQGLRLLRAALTSAPLYHRAPDALRARLPGAARPAPAPFSRRRVVGPDPRRDRGRDRAPGHGDLGGRAAPGGRAAEDRLADRVVVGHIRALQVDHATDVASSDRHTVKPWFLGKLDFSPQVVDLSAAGYALTGGRLDYLTDRPVAALVYHRRLHAINVFTWPAAGTEERPVGALHRQGFHIRSWQRAGMVYWAISDLNDQELDDFVRLLRESAPPAP
ncbi:anti-sigma factor family protein [Frigoriglobus tundricola]|uniref:Putative zinc-finger domain-containing protein n=1 Tax=Frigoriglobus tundricola TaxID=2774151 RepID=A0A6M5YN51_9BACT|nr:zf-HC2 domain-containing protein [Frigoriglobus tundricola]QJW94382.1 hypothetical protein FTUN_1902 [Frigoriglobus tundricola]